MRTNFERAVELTLPFEGGYSNHPRDPGGPTMKGVTLATFSNYLGRQATIAELKAITDDQLRGVAMMFWTPLRCDELPSGVDYEVFDQGWGSGPRPAALRFQRVLGVKADGWIGPITLEAARKADQRKLIRDYAASYLAFMQSLSTWDVFGDGWTWRVNGVRESALAMVGSTPEQPAVVTSPAPETRPIDEEQPVAKPEEPSKGFGFEEVVKIGLVAGALFALRRPITGLFRWSKDWLESGNQKRALVVVTVWLAVATAAAVVILELF